MNSLPAFLQLPPRLAGVDIGTNTCSMVIVGRDSASGRYQIMEDYSVVAGLGRQRMADGTLHPDSIDRVLAVLGLFRRRLVMLDVPRIVTGATAAARQAPNGRAFAHEASERLGVPVEIISGIDEADATFAAVSAEFAPEGKLTMIDVGGGSTEVVHGEPQDLQRISIPLGAVICTEQQLSSRVPPRAADLAELAEQVTRSLDSTDVAAQHVIGVAGTATTLLAVHRAIEPYDSAAVHGATITADELEQTESSMATKTVEQIAALPGMQAGRAPFIVAGSRILRTVLGMLGANEMTVSDRGLRFGLLYREFPQLRID